MSMNVSVLLETLTSSFAESSRCPACSLQKGNALTSSTQGEGHVCISFFKEAIIVAPSHKHGLITATKAALLIHDEKSAMILVERIEGISAEEKAEILCIAILKDCALFTAHVISSGFATPSLILHHGWSAPALAVYLGRKGIFQTLQGLESPPGRSTTTSNSSASSAGESRAVWSPSGCIVGHRGSGADNAAIRSASQPTPLHLENTMESLAAAGIAGASYVEFDVQLSRDGIPIIHHDWTVRLPGESCVRVPVGLLTAQQFLSLEPQDMVNDASTDEVAMAKAADAAAAAADSSSETVDLKSSELLASSSCHTLSSSSSSSGERKALRFTTLEAVLETLPLSLGFNIEVKYPMASEIALLGLRVSSAEDLVDRILRVVTKARARGFSRKMVFSSFDPDVCSLLKKKQGKKESGAGEKQSNNSASGGLNDPSIPVLFLTEAGTPDEPSADARMNSLEAAVTFVQTAGLDGIVTDVRPLINAPELIGLIQGVGIALASYGRRNNEIDIVKLQLREGISAVIVDHVETIITSLR